MAVLLDIIMMGSLFTQCTHVLTWWLHLVFAAPHQLITFVPDNILCLIETYPACLQTGRAFYQPPLPHLSSWQLYSGLNISTCIILSRAQWFIHHIMVLPMYLLASCHAILSCKCSDLVPHDAVASWPAQQAFLAGFSCTVDSPPCTLFNGALQ